jgi:hypothetical protein
MIRRSHSSLDIRHSNVFLCYEEENLPKSLAPKKILTASLWGHISMDYRLFESLVIWRIVGEKCSCMKSLES